METLYPLSNVSNSYMFSNNQSTNWTKEENKEFERALAIFDENTPDKWFRIAAMIPGKSVPDVINKYTQLVEDIREIEADRFPVSEYFTSPLSWDSFDSRDFDGCRKKPSGCRGSDQERKKGIPWTEDEHRRFLMGLLKYGKGDWRNISRNFVVSKTPTQVASHAQKYFIRQHSGGKDKRRPSIHDITTLNLTENIPSNTRAISLQQPDMLLSIQQKCSASPKTEFDRDPPNDGTSMLSDSTRASPFVSTPFRIAPYGLHENNSTRGVYGWQGMKSPSPVFGIHSSGHHILG